MRRPVLASAFSMLVALPTIVAACSTDNPAAGPGPAPAAPPDATTNRDASATADTSTPRDAHADGDAAELPQLALAKGNPCRGVPLPPDQHYVPTGMCGRVVASVFQPRQLTFAPNGDLFAVNLGGTIMRFHDDDGDGYFQDTEVSTYAETGGNGNNCHIDPVTGYLYAGGPDGVMRWPYGPSAKDGGASEDVVVGQGADGSHPKHTVHVYDGYLYVQSGSDGNTTSSKGASYDDERSLIRRFKLSSFTPGTPLQWLSGEVVSRGLRNPNGFTKNAAGRMYAVVNGIDSLSYDDIDVHNDNPGEQLVEIAMGKAFGFPFCFTAQRVVVGGVVVAPGTQLTTAGVVHDDAWCAANSSKPTTFFQAHSAPLDLTFFDTHPKGGLPERYRGGAFVALHGSFNRDSPTGYKVVWVPFDAAGQAPMPTSTATDTTFPYETVFGGGNAAGPVDGPWTWAIPPGNADAPRPAGVAISPVDGALYVTSDDGNYIYRVGKPN